VSAGPRSRPVASGCGAAVVVMLMLMPVVPLARIEANAAVPSIVIDLVIVTAPNPPGSITLISPLMAVFEIAPANVLHGAVRLHGFASSPTPLTHVRVACAAAVDAVPRTRVTIAVARTINFTMA